MATWAAAYKATKNEEFDADQLDAWAEMLQLLEEIAGEQMPSVAELLAEAADLEAAARLLLPATQFHQEPDPGGVAIVDSGNLNDDSPR